MTEKEVAWLAGWLEGEGSFIVRFDHLGRFSMRISGASTDRDTIERVQRLAGGVVHVSEGQQTHWKRQWHWRLQRRAEARGLMCRLWPYMGVRRKVRIIEVLAEDRIYGRAHARQERGAAAVSQRTLWT
jgi:hypothetical protein